MHPRLPAVRLRALTPVIVVVGIGAALLVPRPGEDTRALAPATSAPVPQEEFTPIVVEAPPRADAVELPTASPSAWAAKRWERDIDAGTAETVAPPPARTSPKPMPVRAPVSPPKGPTHVVVAGDTLWTITRRHSASLAAIQRWNPGVDAYRLVAGQRILVPGGSTMRASPRPAAPRPAKVANSGTPRASTPRTTTPRPTTPRASRPPARSTIDHLWPLAVRGTITRQFSAAHLGVDIAAPLGTPVRAVAAGTVTWAGWKANGGGSVVVIRHPDGMRSTYNHNSKVDVAVGERVTAGQTIARVGSTGWSTGPHLDVRIEMGGRFIDPLDVL